MTLRKKVVVTRDLGPDIMPLFTSLSSSRSEEIEVVVWPEETKCTRQWLLDNVKSASGILVMLTEKVDEELIDAAGPELRVVSTMSVGYEHVDTQLLVRRNIRIGYTPGVLTDAVADISVMLALMATRNVGHALSVVQQGNWPQQVWSPFALCGSQISPYTYPSGSVSPPVPHAGITVGFLGFGRIAQATLKRLVSGFGGIRECIYVPNPSNLTANRDKYTARDDELLKVYQDISQASSSLGGGDMKLGAIKPVSLEALASESDILFVCTPSTPSTYHVINSSFLRRMKKTSVVINTARGGCVDSDDLALALREGWIWSAGVDCVEGEPAIQKDHPLVREPRCIVLPHIGSATFETRHLMARLAVENLMKGIWGEQLVEEVES